MRGKSGHCPVGIVLVFAALVSGCAGDGTDKNAPIDRMQPTKLMPRMSVPPAKVSDRPGNTSGLIPVLEYHNIEDKKGDFYRRPADFAKDLDRLYKDGFRPVTVSEFLSNKMNLGKGASPVVMTFDDASPSQIKLRDDGSVDPDCAAGIWLKFAERHPDFPLHATFFVLPSMWGQKKWIQKKVQLVGAWGSELANHTTTHPRLSKLSDDQVKKEIATASDRLASYGVQMPPSLALPYGISPKNKALLKSFSYNGKQYTLKAVFLVGANPSLPPTAKKFDAYRIPRIQAYPGELGSDYWLGLMEKGKVKLYVQP